MDFRKCFKDKVVLVTGASKGIGKEIAMSFANLGAKVAINYSKSDKPAEEVRENIINSGGEAILAKADVGKINQVKSMINMIREELGSISILVNNAGIALWAPFIEIEESDFNKVIETNLKGAFLCSQEVVKDMIKNKYGKVVNISSVIGNVANLNLTHYCISKSGVIMLTKTMAYELGKYNINVNSIGPATVVTDINKEFTARDDIKTKEEKVTPLGRLGNTKDIANLSVFLASDYASWITGQVIMVDGGLSCRTPQEFYPD
jgi:NAD(P)-dependent dehydrogenase (short-subunit alcohol dehydrogenase family)